MATVLSYDDIINRVSGNFVRTDPFYGERQAATTATLFTGQSAALQRSAYIQAIDNPLPTGVSAFLPVTIGFVGSALSTIMIARQFPMGNINIATGTYTAGSAMPTKTIGNTATQQLYGAILAECTTVLNSNAGTITITYNNQAGSSKSTAALTCTNSSTVQTMGFALLAAGDWGASNITNVTHAGGASPTGVISFFGILPICMIPNPAVGAVGARSLLTSIPFPPSLLAGEQIAIIGLSNAARAVSGVIKYVGDS